MIDKKNKKAETLQTWDKNNEELLSLEVLFLIRSHRDFFLIHFHSVIIRELRKNIPFPIFKKSW